MAAIEGLDQAGALRLVQARESRYFRTVEDVKQALGANWEFRDNNAIDTRTSFFEVRGRLRLDGTTVEERSLVQRRNGQVFVLWRQRSALPRV